MGTARFDHGMARLEDALFVCGGAGTHGTILASLERYDPLSDTWHTLADLKEVPYSIV